jgi:hypothetical protein
VALVRPESPAASVVRRATDTRRENSRKCSSVPEESRVPYLESRVDGVAWLYINDTTFEDYFVILEALDPYYGRSPQRVPSLVLIPC